MGPGPLTLRVPPLTDEQLAALTPRQREVYALAQTGLTSREIAARLWIVPDAVRVHLRQIRKRTGGAVPITKKAAMRAAHRWCASILRAALDKGPRGDFGIDCEADREHIRAAVERLADAHERKANSANGGGPR